MKNRIMPCLVAITVFAVQSPAQGLRFRDLVGKSFPAFQAQLGKPAEKYRGAWRYQTPRLAKLGIRCIMLCEGQLIFTSEKPQPIWIQFDTKKVKTWQDAFSVLGLETDGIQVIDGQGGWPSLKGSLREFYRDLDSTAGGVVPVQSLYGVKLTNGNVAPLSTKTYPHAMFGWYFQFEPKSTFDGGYPEMMINFSPVRW